MGGSGAEQALHLRRGGLGIKPDRLAIVVARLEKMMAAQHVPSELYPLPGIDKKVQPKRGAWVDYRPNCPTI